MPALLGLVEPTRRGDPQSALSWTTLSTPKLAAELNEAGHPPGIDADDPLLVAARLLAGGGDQLPPPGRPLHPGLGPRDVVQHLEAVALDDRALVDDGDHHPGLSARLDGDLRRLDADHWVGHGRLLPGCRAGGVTPAAPA